MSKVVSNKNLFARKKLSKLMAKNIHALSRQSLLSRRPISNCARFAQLFPSTHGAAWFGSIDSRYSDHNQELIPCSVRFKSFVQFPRKQNATVRTLFCIQLNFYEVPKQSSVVNSKIVRLNAKSLDNSSSVLDFLLFEMNICA